MNIQEINREFRASAHRWNDFQNSVRKAALLPAAERGDIMRLQDDLTILRNGLEMLNRAIDMHLKSK